MAVTKIYSTLVFVVAALIAMVLALPIGLVLGHTGRGGFLAINVTNVGRALPAIAVLVIILRATTRVREPRPKARA